ncbi:MAG: hypothetical protein ACJ76H_05965 [Bacteriovoracaceae bacterium]
MNLSPAMKKYMLAPPSESGLVYDLTSMAERAVAAKKNLGAQTLLIAVKSFPDASALQKILPLIDGADVSNYREYCLVKEYGKNLTLWLTRCPLDDFRKILSENPKATIWYNVENPSDLPELIALKENHQFKLSLRVNTTSLLPENHPLKYLSRFGLEHREVENLLKDNGKSIDGIHLHHASEKNDRALLQIFLHYFQTLKKKHSHLSMFNIGGGWNIRDESLLEEISRSSLDLTLEPGRSFSQDLGFAFTRISSIKRFSDRVIIEGNLSARASLQWSHVTGHAFFSVGKETRLEVKGEVFYGSQTCDESDLLRLSLDNSYSLAVGDHVVFSGLNGYSAAWNHSFNGIVTPIHLIE